MKKILVTGGAGFLGSHLCEKLLEFDNYVICLDNFYTGSKENINKFDDPKSRKPNIELTRIKLNWKPKININEGLTLTIDYFKSLLN